MKKNSFVEKIIKSRHELVNYPKPNNNYKLEEEGGCGVTGFACSIPVKGKHIFEPSIQMHNRGNGKGGGVAAVGLCAEDLGVSTSILENDYIIQIALLDDKVRYELEKQFIKRYFKIDKEEKIETIDDFREIEGLEVKPPDVYRYFVRVKPDVLDKFAKKNNLKNIDIRKVEDEFVYQNSYKLNKKFYASEGEKKAFVLSHGRNMLVLKIVGYAEQLIKYYKLDNFRANIWIAHQRYPTKGKVWHPGGAHPFVGLNEALVHNGDFANYHSICEYLKQRNIQPLFLTDTEVAVLLFDLLNRTYEYPLEYIIEALAPTTERDFDLLPKDKQKIYRAIQSSCMHGSPDGPWFFIIARYEPYKKYLQLIGITDTSMLRPQVFAIFENNEVQIGFICSEKQAIDATLHSLSSEDKRFCKIADKYWNARGGSHTDGGSFIFTIKDGKLICTDKFGKIISLPKHQKHFDETIKIHIPENKNYILGDINNYLENDKVEFCFNYFKDNILKWDYNTFRYICNELIKISKENDEKKRTTIELLTLLNDRRYNTGDKKRSSILQIIQDTLYEIFSSTPTISQNSSSVYCKISFEDRRSLREPRGKEKILVIDASNFPPEGDLCDARLTVDAYNMGWKRFIIYGHKGQRFCGCGLGPDSKEVRIDVYGSPGDYLASGIDGLQIYVHNNAQDQVGQIMKEGKLVIYGDVGQTFMYGAKGGEVYVLGNAAGRPLINAVGKPRVVINGTCLDYLAESFMAGDPLLGGGFVILNGIEFDEKGVIKEQETPYPGSNLFSLASGGAIYIRDPHFKVVEEQLNGGEFSELTQDDWNLILPYLKENEKLFGISIEENLLCVNGTSKKPNEIYRKVKPIK